MNSIRQIYKIGTGPSSSHSMGPRRAGEIFRRRLTGRPVAYVEVQLHGSLAATGKGHLTDHAVAAGLSPLESKTVWMSESQLPLHPNGMVFRAIDADGKCLDNWQVYSIGGGDLLDESGPVAPLAEGKYEAGSIHEVLAICEKNSWAIWQYVQQQESADIWDLLKEVWRVMVESVQRGISAGGTLPGSLRLERRAPNMLINANERVGFLRDVNLISSYALAVAEENAAGGQIATAPTCGSAGLLPGVLYYFFKHNRVPQETILHALATAGLFGSVVAERASISGAQVGCQGEIGTACAMAAAAAAQISGADPQQVEYAAEMGMEHCLGLTCDPIDGLVQVPCIERNAVLANHAICCAAFAMATNGRHLVHFEDVVDVMNQTGRDLQCKYRETARGGLAEIMRSRLGL